MSFAKKLARLPALERPAEVAAAPIERPVESPASGLVESARKPTLDELRERIARVLARGGNAPPAVVRKPVACDLPFVREETPSGPLDRLVRPTPHGHRVGAVPVWAAKTADPALLALLALDPVLAGCDPRRAVYLDTETTGLSSAAGTVPFLIGLGLYDEDAGRFVVEQLLLKGLGDESPMLEHLARRLEDASMIVTFNGKSFDMPLLRTRTVLNRVPRLPDRPHLDLLHVARRLHKHRLPSCSLGALEDAILGRQRVGDVSGADIAAIYHHYVRSGDETALVPVIEHNALDVISMFALVGLYGEPLDHWATDAAARLPGAARGPALEATDFSAAARVARRAGDLSRALVFAEESVARGAGLMGHHAFADVAKARGDKAAALREYEHALELARAAGEELEPVAELLRHELAKLYEHHARAYELAIALVAEGTVEAPEKRDARLARLVKKRDKTRQAAAPGAAPSKASEESSRSGRLRLSASRGWSKVRPP